MVLPVFETATRMLSEPVWIVTLINPYFGFACQSPRQQGLACAGRAHQQSAFGKPGADGRILVRMLHKVHDFLQSILGFLLAGYILEGDAGLEELFLKGKKLSFADETVVQHNASDSHTRNVTGYGYQWTAFIQMGILLVCILSLPLWKQSEKQETEKENRNSAGIKETLKVPGVVLTLIAFFAYCSGEATCFLWTPSFFAGTKEGLSAETIASFGSLIFGGLMLGRLISGFISNRLGDRLLIRIGIAVELIGVLLIFLPIPGYVVAAIGFVVIGTGMGPVYPAIQHMAPANFGKRHSAAVIGLQMASAYIGSTFMPMVFGNLQQHMGIGIMPVYLLIFALLNISMLEIAYRKVKNSNQKT